MILWLDGDGVGDDDFLEDSTAEALRGRWTEHGMCCTCIHLPGPFCMQDLHPQTSSE